MAPNKRKASDAPSGTTPDKKQRPSPASQKGKPTSNGKPSSNKSASFKGKPSPTSRNGKSASNKGAPSIPSSDSKSTSNGQSSSHKFKSGSHKVKPGDKKFITKEPSSYAGLLKKGSHKGSNKGKQGSAKGTSDKQQPSFTKSGKMIKQKVDADDKPSPFLKQDANASKAKKQMITKHNRRVSKPHYELVAAANQLWTINLSALPKSERESKCDEIMTTLGDKIHDLCVKHDTSRVLQFICKLGTAKHRTEIHKQLRTHYVKHATDHYGHHVVIKLLQYGDDTIKQEITSELIPSIVKLSMHTYAASVIDYIYASTTTQQQRWNLLQPFYLPEFSVFQSSESTAHTNLSLSQVIDMYPLKKQSILEHVQKYIDRAILKKMLMFRFLHGLIWEYLSVLSTIPSDPSIPSLTEMITNLSSTLPQLFRSTEGTRIICYLLGYGTAKDRKMMVKSIKGLVPEMCQHSDGFLSIARALDVIDDTVLLHKQICNEMIDHMETLIIDPYAGKVMLSLLQPREIAYFTPKENEMMKIPMQKVGDTWEPTSKKNPADRRSQVLSVLLDPMLVACTTHLSTLLITHAGVNLVYEIIREANIRVSNPDQSKEWKAAHKTLGTHLHECYHALGEMCGQTDLNINLCVSRIGHYVIKRLLERLSPNAYTFSDIIYQYIQPIVNELSQQNRGCFILTSLVAHASPDTTSSLRTQLLTLPHLSHSHYQSTQPPTTISKPKNKKRKQDGEETESTTSDAGRYALLKMLYEGKSEGLAGKAKIKVKQNDGVMVETKSMEIDEDGTQDESTASQADPTPTPAKTPAAKKSKAKAPVKTPATNGPTSAKTRGQKKAIQ